MKGKNKNAIPMYPYIYVSMKGRTETQDPILAMNLRKGRTEIQNPCALKKGKRKNPRTDIIVNCYAIYNHEGKNRNPKCPYTHVNAVIL